MVTNQERMYTNARFAVAVHILTFVAMRGPTSQSITSSMIAESVDTHPVVIRRILGVLRQAQLVVSQPGTGGGWTLAKPAQMITLLQIYRAVKETPLFTVHRHPPNAGCPIGQNMVDVLNIYFAQAESAVEKQLECVTLDHIVNAVAARMPAVTPPPRTLAKQSKNARRAV